MLYFSPCHCSSSLQVRTRDLNPDPQACHHPASPVLAKEPAARSQFQKVTVDIPGLPQTALSCSALLFFLPLKNQDLTPISDTQSAKSIQCFPTQTLLLLGQLVCPTLDSPVKTFGCSHVLSSICL